MASATTRNPSFQPLPAHTFWPMTVRVWFGTIDVFHVWVAVTKDREFLRDQPEIPLHPLALRAAHTVYWLGPIPVKRPVPEEYRRAVVTVFNQPLIRLPREGEHIGERVYAEGWVPYDRIGIFAVEPLNSSPAVVIQPFVPDVFGDSVSATVSLGDPHTGAREKYRIYLLACKTDHQLKNNMQTTLEEVRPVCAWSRPATVYRER